MNNDRSFYICNKCGNLIEMIEDSGVKNVCCNEEMVLLVPNTTEAAHEKHIPIATWDGDELTVTVSSTLHPMTVEHHISWIAIAQNNLTQRMSLEKTASPVAKFCVPKGNTKLFAYCNLHGLWTSEVTDIYFNETVCSPDFSEGCM